MVRMEMDYDLKNYTPRKIKAIFKLFRRVFKHSMLMAVVCFLFANLKLFLPLDVQRYHKNSFISRTFLDSVSWVPLIYETISSGWCKLPSLGSQIVHLICCSMLHLTSWWIPSFFHMPYLKLVSSAGVNAFLLIPLEQHSKVVIILGGSCSYTK